MVRTKNLSGRNVVLLLGDDALVRLLATKSTPPRLYLITGPLSPEKVGGPKSVGLIEAAPVPFYFWPKSQLWSPGEVLPWAWLGNTPTIRIKTLAE